MSRININIPQEEHVKLKIIAAATSTSIKDLVLSALQDKIQHEMNKQLNQDTLAAFRETDTSTGITKHSNLAELMKDLGLSTDEVN